MTATFAPSPAAPTAEAQPRRSAADDHEVLARRRRGIFQVRRMHVGNGLLIVRVPRLDGRLSLLAHVIVPAELHFSAVTHEGEGRRAFHLFQICAVEIRGNGLKRAWKKGRPFTQKGAINFTLGLEADVGSSLL